MNPSRISEEVNRLVAGTEPVVNGRTEEKEEYRQSKIDVAKQAAGLEHNYWNWISGNRHKRMQGTLIQADTEPPDRKKAEEIASEYYPFKNSGK